MADLSPSRAADSASFRMPASARVERLSLAVADLERSLEFYRRILGLHALDRQPGRAALGPLGSSAAGAFLTLQEIPGARPKPQWSTGLYHFAVLVLSRSDLGQWLRNALQEGFPLQGASDHLVSEAIYLADPDGNGIEVYRDRPQAEWPIVGGKILMATDPLDMEGVLKAAGHDARWTGMSPGTRLGHIHLQVADIQTAAGFYVDALGFDRVAEVPGALFVSAGGYHHHIGMNTWQSRGRGLAPAGSAGLLDYTLRLPDAETLRQVVGRVRAADGSQAESAWETEFLDPFGIRIRLEADGV